MADLSDVERQNAKLVEDFIKGWLVEDFDAATQYPEYLAADAVVRMQDDHPPLIGAAAAADAIKTFMAAGGLVKTADTDELFVRGPLVVTIRRDTVTIPDQGDVDFKIAAVFIVKNAKITEWTEYIY